MVDLGSEENLGGNHWVLLGQVEFQVEKTALIWAVSWTGHLHKEVSAVGLRWLSIDSNNYTEEKKGVRILDY